jgi:hypothetical protein
VFSVPSVAQETPAFELYSGYLYSRINPGEGVDGANLNGWSAALQINANHWLSFVADFGGVYGTPRVRVPGSPARDIDSDVHYFLFGPRFTARQHERITPFVHTLFGAVRGSGAPLLGAVAGGQPLFVAEGSNTVFGLALGGGLDVTVREYIAIRFVQADYLLTRFEGANRSVTNQHNARISAGVVFRFGSRE